jgi:hypothetical protein
MPKNSLDYFWTLEEELLSIVNAISLHKASKGSAPVEE